jgi:undecaprenyl-diphosphatase
LALALLVVGAAAVVLSLLVTGPLAPFLNREVDAPASRYFLSHPPAGASVFRSVSELGSPAAAGTIVMACCTIIAVCTRAWVPMCLGAAAWAGALVIAVVARLVTSRWHIYGPARGFPSGHALIAASVFGILAVLAARSPLPRHIKVPLVVLGVTVPLAVAWSRLVLLAHPPSDVIGGGLLGAAWAAAVVLAVGVPRSA